MDFSFGIITNNGNDDFLKSIIGSIENNDIPHYEIIIVGNSSLSNNDYKNTKIINFDESVKKDWITRKKNIIIDEAIYENIVIIHDYIVFDKDWYKGFLLWGNNFEYCISPIKNLDGRRFRDYCLFPYTVDHLNIDYSPCDIDYYFYNHCLLPYSFENTLETNKYMYISGAYFIIKKKIGMRFHLDETLCWGFGEDVEYSKRLHANNIIIKCNPYSFVYFLKFKESVHFENEISEEKLKLFIDFCDLNKNK